MPNTVSKKHHVMLKKSMNEYPFFQKNKELVAIMDWYSRKVLSWKLSNSLDSDSCFAALEEDGTPEILNTNQGSQFTSYDFTQTLKDVGVRISIDGKGRWMDNVMIELIWRTLKYSFVYLHAFDSGH